MSRISTTKTQDSPTFTISDGHAGRKRPDAELREFEYKREAENLKKAHQEIEHLLSSLSTIIIGLSPQNYVNRFNPFAENVFGLKAADVIGQPLSSSCIPWDGSRVQNGLTSCRRQGGPTRVDDITFKRSNGKQGYLGITINPIRTNTGHFLGFIIIGADVTERKALESTRSIHRPNMSGITPVFSRMHSMICSGFWRNIPVCFRQPKPTRCPRRSSGN